MNDKLMGVIYDQMEAGFKMINRFQEQNQKINETTLEIVKMSSQVGFNDPQALTQFVQQAQAKAENVTKDTMTNSLEAWKEMTKFQAEMVNRMFSGVGISK